MKAMFFATLLVVLAGVSRADAQVIGTYGTPGTPLGYYSPYPGALYSPYRMPQPMYSQSFRPSYVTGFPNGTMVVPNYPYSTMPGSPAFPRYINGPFPNAGQNPFPNGNRSAFPNPNPYRRN